MPPLFDQYKLMDRGATKKFADAGGKDTIKNILIAAANKQDSQIATALLIRDLLNFKVAQATDKKNTTDPERWLKILPTHIEAVNKLLPQNDVNSLLTEINLRQFIANSSSIFQRQIPGTFKAVLDEVIRLPGVKSRLVDSYTAKFLKSNSVAGITDNDVRNAHNVETRKRPTALEIKKFLMQFCNLPKDCFPTLDKNQNFDSACTWVPISLTEYCRLCINDWDRNTNDYLAVDYIGYTIDQGWNIHVFKVLEFVKKVGSHSNWAPLKTNLTSGQGVSLWNKLTKSLRLEQLPTIKIFNRFNKESKLHEESKLQNITEPPAASWLVFCSGVQTLFPPITFMCGMFSLFASVMVGRRDEAEYAIAAIQNLEKKAPKCALPGGWTDMQYMQIHLREMKPLSYNLVSKSFKKYAAYELYWVPQGIEQRSYNNNISNLVGDDEIASFPTQGSWWVILTLEIGFEQTNNTIQPKLVGQRYSWEVFDSKPHSPRTTWPNPNS